MAAIVEFLPLSNLARCMGYIAYSAPDTEVELKKQYAPVIAAHKTMYERMGK